MRAESVFLVSFQVVLILLVLGSHLENHCSKSFSPSFSVVHLHFVSLLHVGINLPLEEMNSCEILGLKIRDSPKLSTLG